MHQLLLIILSILLLHGPHVASSTFKADLNPSHQILIQDDTLQIGGAPFPLKSSREWSSHLLSACQDGNEVACHYDEILLRIKSAVGELRTAKDASLDDSDAMELNTSLINELTILASFHKDELDYASQDDSLDIVKQHYDRAQGALLACEYYHLVTWELLANEDKDATYDINATPFVYERHAVSLGVFGVSLHLSDLYDRYYAIYHEIDDVDEFNEEQTAGRMREGYTHSYRYLLSCEHWCLESSLLLDSIDLDKESMYLNGQDTRLEMKQQHEMYVFTTQQSCAHSKVRLGTLLLTMYAAGYTLSSDEMLSYNPVAQTVILQESGYDIQDEQEQYSHDIVEGIKRDQERLLQSVVEKLQAGIEMYSKLAPNTEFGDNRINLADSHHHLGVTHQYLGDYMSAITEWKSSLDLYRELFQEYSSSSDSVDIVGVTSITDIVQSLITTSQQCCDALLSLGHYEETKDMYRLNLKLRRILIEGTTIDDDLLDQDGDYTDALYDQDDWNSPQYGELPAFATDRIDESIKEHQALLDEYYKTLRNNPDGSYYDVSFDIDGSQLASMAASDKVYEGSIKSVIGSLHLAKNDARAARDELEPAIELLRKGIQDDESGMRDTPAQDANGNTIALSLYLADALLNLAYAQAGTRQWHASMASFEDALVLYEKELPEGQSPFTYDNENGGKAADMTQQRDGLLERLKRKLALQVEEFNQNVNSTAYDNDEL